MGQVHSFSITLSSKKFDSIFLRLSTDYNIDFITKNIYNSNYLEINKLLFYTIRNYVLLGINNSDGYKLMQMVINQPSS
jgi:hypothetical protein